MTPGIPILDVTRPCSLEELNLAIHDLWVSPSTFCLDSSARQLRIELESSKGWFDSLLGRRRRRFTLMIAHVKDYEVEDPEKTDYYVISHVDLSSCGSTLVIQLSGRDVRVRVELQGLRIRLFEVEPQQPG